MAQGVQLVRSLYIDYDFCQIAFNLARARAGLLCILAATSICICISVSAGSPFFRLSPHLFRSNRYPSLSVTKCMANVTHAFQFEFTIFLASNAGMWLRVFSLPSRHFIYVLLWCPTTVCRLSLPQFSYLCRSLPRSVCHLHTLHLSEFNHSLRYFCCPELAEKCVYLLYGFLMSSIVSRSHAILAAIFVPLLLFRFLA